MKIILVGFMGSGKSTVGKQLAAKLQLPFIDSDAWIEEQTGSSVSRIFELEGESGFREWEQRFVSQLNKEPQVVSCGGGLPCFNDLMVNLKEQGTVVYLKTSVETLVNRLILERADRPLVASVSEETFLEEITNRLSAREPVYQQAHQIIETDGKSIQEIVDEIADFRSSEFAN
ncbi:MAG: shikimate kinase [Fluviicola sp.]|nr:shikimate kinase [Fluviicola sp.]